MENLKTLCAFLAAALALSGTAAFAHSATDPFATGRVLEFSIGGEFTLNTLQEQLTTPNGVLSVGLSVQYEQSLSQNSYFTAELGYDGHFDVMNGFDTFIDVLGTLCPTQIDRDHIGSAYLNIGLVHRF